MGVAHHVDRLPEWGRHRVWYYPIRPVDFWHALELAVPVESPEDDDILAPVVDDLCAELAAGVLERSLNAFVSRVDEQGFGYLLAQPHYLGFTGFLMISSSGIQRCWDEGLLRSPARSMAAAETSSGLSCARICQ